MNTGGGEAADQLVRMILSGSETFTRLSGSAMKNLLALTMALAKDHKRLSGKVNMRKMLRQTRDIRLFPMTRSQYKRFRRLAKRQKLLYSAIRDKGPKGGKLIDVVMPVTELDRANLIFERILYREPGRQPEEQSPQKEKQGKEVSQPEKDRQEKRLARERLDKPVPEKDRVDPQKDRCQPDMPKKDSRWSRDLPVIKDRSSIYGRSRKKTTSERTSVEARLKGYQKRLQTRRESAPAKIKSRKKNLTK